MINIMLLLIAVLLLIIDCLQTLDIKNHSNLHEINILLGPHPSDTRIGIYFALCGLIAIGLACVLPWSLFAFAVLVLAGIEVPVIINNRRLGLQIIR